MEVVSQIKSATQVDTDTRENFANEFPDRFSVAAEISNLVLASLPLSETITGQLATEHSQSSQEWADSREKRVSWRLLQCDPEFTCISFERSRNENERRTLPDLV